MSVQSVFCRCVPAIFLAVLTTGAAAEPTRFNFSALNESEFGNDVSNLFPDDAISGYLAYDSAAKPNYLDIGNAYASFNGVELFIDQIDMTFALDVFEIYAANSELHLESYEPFAFGGQDYNSFGMDFYADFGASIFSEPFGFLPIQINEALATNGQLFGGIFVTDFEDEFNYAPLTYTAISIGDQTVTLPPPIVDGDGNLRLGGDGLPAGAEIDTPKCSTQTPPRWASLRLPSSSSAAARMMQRNYGWVATPTTRNPRTGNTFWRADR